MTSSLFFADFATSCDGLALTHSGGVAILLVGFVLQTPG